MTLVKSTFDIWVDLVGEINETHPNTDNFQRQNFENHENMVTHIYHKGELFSINIYHNTGTEYLINSKFLP